MRNGSTEGRGVEMGSFTGEPSAADGVEIMRYPHFVPGAAVPEVGRNSAAIHFVDNTGALSHLVTLVLSVEFFSVARLL